MRIIALMLMVACGSSKETSEETEVTSELKELRVEPAEIQLSTDGDAPDEIQFVAYAKTETGEEVPTDMVSWSVSNLSAGSIDNDGLFTTAILNGGITTVTATHVGVEASATVTVVYEQDQVVGEARRGTSAFASATPAAGARPSTTHRKRSPSRETSTAWPLDGARPREPTSRACGFAPASPTCACTPRAELGHHRGCGRPSRLEHRGLVEISIASETWDGANL